MTGVEHRVSRLAELCAVDICLPHMDSTQETTAVSPMLTDRCILCSLSRHSAVYLWIQLEQERVANNSEWLSP